MLCAVKNPNSGPFCPKLKHSTEKEKIKKTKKRVLLNYHLVYNVKWLSEN